MHRFTTLPFYMTNRDTYMTRNKVRRSDSTTELFDGGPRKAPMPKPGNGRAVPKLVRVPTTSTSHRLLFFTPGSFSGALYQQCTTHSHSKLSRPKLIKCRAAHRPSLWPVNLLRHGPHPHFPVGCPGTYADPGQPDEHQYHNLGGGCSVHGGDGPSEAVDLDAGAGCGRRGDRVAGVEGCPCRQSEDRRL